MYLTADSPNTLTELDKSKIYVVGGIVDRNRLKGVTFKAAEEAGVETGKLPLAGEVGNANLEVDLDFVALVGDHIKAVLVAQPARHQHVQERRHRGDVVALETEPETEFDGSGLDVLTVALC